MGMEYGARGGARRGAALVPVALHPAVWCRPTCASSPSASIRGAGGAPPDAAITGRAFARALAFVLGFSAWSFVAFGAAATALGSFVSQHMILLSQIAGRDHGRWVLGLHMLGVFRWFFLMREARVARRGEAREPGGRLRRGPRLRLRLVAPAVGPVLASILNGRRAIGERSLEARGAGRARGLLAAGHRAIPVFYAGLRGFVHRSVFSWRWLARFKRPISGRVGEGGDGAARNGSRTGAAVSSSLDADSSPVGLLAPSLCLGRIGLIRADGLMARGERAGGAILRQLSKGGIFDDRTRRADLWISWARGRARAGRAQAAEGGAPASRAETYHAAPDAGLLVPLSRCVPWTPLTSSSARTSRGNAARRGPSASRSCGSCRGLPPICRDTPPDHLRRPRRSTGAPSLASASGSLPSMMLTPSLERAGGWPSSPAVAPLSRLRGRWHAHVRPQYVRFTPTVMQFLSPRGGWPRRPPPEEPRGLPHARLPGAGDVPADVRVRGGGGVIADVRVEDWLKT